MIISENLSEIYMMFIHGMTLGSLLSAIPFIIGYAINGIYTLIRENV